MKLTILLAVGLMFAVSAAQGQSPKGLAKGSKPKPVLDWQTPVTRSEMGEAFAAVEKALRTTLALKGSTTRPKLASGFASREEMIRGLTALMELTKPAFRYKPSPVPFDPASLKVQASARKELETLVRWGFVAKAGPLSSRSTPSLKISEFGDALGFFMARVADLTHTPSTRFSPYLQHP